MRGLSRSFSRSRSCYKILCFLCLLLFNPAWFIVTVDLKRGWVSCRALIIYSTSGLFIESLLSIFRMHWDHELGVAASRQSAANPRNHFRRRSPETPLRNDGS